MGLDLWIPAHPFTAFWSLIRAQHSHPLTDISSWSITTTPNTFCSQALSKAEPLWNKPSSLSLALQISSNSPSQATVWTPWGRSSSIVLRWVSLASFGTCNGILCIILSTLVGFPHQQCRWFLIARAMQVITTLSTTATTTAAMTSMINIPQCLHLKRMKQQPTTTPNSRL